MYISSFNVILRNNEKKVTINSNTTTFSENLSVLSTYALELGGVIVNNTTISFNDEDSFIEFVNKLLEF